MTFGAYISANSSTTDTDRVRSTRSWCFSATAAVEASLAFERGVGCLHPLVGAVKTALTWRWSHSTDSTIGASRAEITHRIGEVPVVRDGRVTLNRGSQSRPASAVVPRQAVILWVAKRPALAVLA